MIIRCIKFCSIKTGNIKSEKGFTFLELMLVLVVTSIISSALIMPFVSNLNEGARPDIYATAAQLATADIESHRALGFVTGNTSASTVINGRSYTRTVTKSFADASFASGGNTFGSPATNDYILVTAVVATTNPTLSITFKSIITPDYN